MRYQFQDDIQFTLRHKTVTIKANIDYVAPSMSQVTLRVLPGDSLDLLAYKIYGPNMESYAWDIFQENQREIVEAGYNLNLIDKIRVP